MSADHLGEFLKLATALLKTQFELFLGFPIKMYSPWILSYTLKTHMNVEMKSSSIPFKLILSNQIQS